MKKLYILFILLISSLSSFGQEEIIRQADDAYSKSEFKEAISLYESVVKEFGSSSDLYYNLGNAFYKDKQYAAAILNYERALKLAPNNGDARFNLSVARSHIIDKIEPIDSFFLKRWMDSLKYNLSSNGWAVLGAVSFLLFIASLYLYFFNRTVLLRKIGFFGGMVLVVVCLLSNVFASDIRNELLAHDEAIIFAPTVNIKSSPSESGTDIFILHEGSKVQIKSKLSGWAEIELEDGNKGWIPADKMETI